MGTEMITSRAESLPATNGDIEPQANGIVPQPRPVDVDPVETREWLDSLEAVLQTAGEERARFLLTQLKNKANRSGVEIPFTANTPYINTIPAQPAAALSRQPRDRAPHQEPRPLERHGHGRPGQQERRHPRRPHLHLRLVGHALRGRLQPLLPRARSSRRRRPGLLPGPRLARHLRPRLPRRPARPTSKLRKLPPRTCSRRRPVVVSAPVADARLLAVSHRVDGPRADHGASTRRASTATWNIAASRRPAGQHVWCFLGDGECDEPESLGALTLASRERLDNLIFVINCNLQRLDGPVRGNGKIIQELEAAFRGAGWNVIKVIWGSDWDPLLADDKSGLLVKRMGEVVDGEYQKYTVAGGAYIRKHFFGKYPELLKLVEHLSDEQLHQAEARRPRSGEGLRRLQGGRRAQRLADGDPGQDHQGLRPGRGRRGQEHHPPAEEAQREAADRVPQPLRHAAVRRGGGQGRLLQAAGGQPRRCSTCRNARKALGGYLPARVVKLPAAARRPATDFVQPYAKGSGDKAPSTTMVFVDMLGRLLHDKELGKWVVPIIPDEARTFGMDPFFVHVQDLLQRRPALRAGGRRVPGVGLPRGQERPDPGGGHHRGRLDVVVHRRRHRLRHARRADDPVLHLLLDVRLPAHRRPDLGGRRHADARLPAGGDRRPHHAQRRRLAARGRPQPHPGLDGAQPASPTTRPSPSSWPSSSATASAACTRTEGRHFLLHHAVQRQLPDAADAGGRDRGHPQGHVQAAAGRRTPKGKAEGRTCSAAARSCRRPCGAGDAGRAVRRGGRRLERRPATRSCGARRWRSSAGTCCTRRRSRGRATSRRCWRRKRACSWRPAITCGRCRR